MNNIPLWAQIVIALIGSGLFGGVVSIILSPIVARQQIKQQEIAYHQKLNDNFLQNTRQYIDILYIPINKSLSNLETKYDDVKYFQRNELAIIERDKVEAKIAKRIGRQNFKKNPEAIEVEQFAHRLAEKAVTDFQMACLDHHKLMEEILEKGNDIYLTSEFDETLHSFNKFLTISAGFFKSVKILSYREMKQGDALETTLGTLEFEILFYHSIHTLKSYIKEVTLGKGVGSKK